MRSIYLVILFVFMLVPNNVYSQVDISDVLSNAETNISGPSGGNAESGMEKAIKDGDNWELSVHVHLLEGSMIAPVRRKWIDIT